MSIVPADPGSHLLWKSDVGCELQGLKQYMEVNVKISAVFWTPESNTRTCSGEYTYIQYHRRMCPTPAIPSAYTARAENVRKPAIQTVLIVG